MPLHLHPLVAQTFSSVAQGISPAFRALLPSLAWRNVAEVKLCNARLTAADTAKLSYFVEAISNLKKVRKGRYAFVS